MESLISYSKLAGPFLTAISICFGVYVFHVNSRRDRIKKTLDYWEEVNQKLKNEKRELQREYGNKLTHDQANEILSDEDEATVRFRFTLS